MNGLMTLRMALHNLYQHKLRSSLAILGIWVGSGAIVGLIACGTMATNEALSQFKNLGTDFLAVNIQQSYSLKDNKPAMVLELKQVQTLSQVNSAIELVVPFFFIGQSAYYNAKPLNSYVLATTSELQPLFNLSLSTGRFVSEMDQYNSYCVIGAGVAKQLQEQGMLQPMGAQIKLGGTLFTIVGVMDSFASNLFIMADLNQSIIIPMARAYIFDRAAPIDNILIKLKPRSDFITVQQDIMAALNNWLPGQRIEIRSPQQLMEVMLKQQQTFKGLLAAIAAIALLTGGVGVMNIMLVAVSERRREIGLRMAIGARKLDICLLFISEALILSLFGGLLGAITGQIGALIFASIMGWQLAINGWACVAGFMVAASVGVLSGGYPAYAASQLQPLEILLNDS